MYHQCLATFKCQSYDRHNPICWACEEKVRPRDINTGGELAEGENVKDYQLLIRQLQNHLKCAYIHPDNATNIPLRGGETDEAQIKELEEYGRLNNVVVDQGVEYIQTTREVGDFWDKLKG